MRCSGDDREFIMRIRTEKLEVTIEVNMCMCV